MAAGADESVIAELMAAVADLGGQVAALRQQVSTLTNRTASLASPFAQRLFLARHDGRGGDWQEVVPNDAGDALVDFVDGRASAGNDLIDPAAVDGGGEDVCPVLQVRTLGGLKFVMLTPAGEVDIEVTAVTQDGSNKRWKYSWKLKVKSAAGYTGYANASPAVTGPSADWGYAYNRAEVGNASSGTWKNGVSSSNLTGTGLDIKPLAVGRICRATIRRPANGALPELWIESDNAIDGGCA